MTADQSKMNGNSSGVYANVVDFGEKTTFHGCRYALDQTASVIRRLSWLVLVLSCFGLLLFQVIDRIVYYNSKPVTVNVNINYNNTIQFPGVTICNQNTFKATSSAKLERYELINKMYTEASPFGVSELQPFNAGNLSLKDLYFQSTHLKEDLIMSCTYGGRDCDDSDFHIFATDHGVCYTFESKDKDRQISSPGVENGLSLLLNVEQYEYMQGPHSAAGIKMLLHEPGEIPRVHALGQAISPGTSVFVGVKFFEVNNLPKPYGTCQDKTLQYVDMYTKESCQLDCLTMLALEECGCRHTYFPYKNETPPVCTLSKYYGCLKKIIDSFPEVVESRCSCPLPCKLRLYETDISYATLSDHVLEKYLSSNATQNLANNLLQAVEVTSRYETGKFLKTQLLAEKFNRQIDNMQTVISKMQSMIRNSSVKIDSVYSDTLSDFDTKETMFKYQSYIIQKNFIRPRDAMEERTIHIVALAYAEFILTVENNIRRLGNSNFTDDSARLVIYDVTLDMLNNRQEIISRAMNNYSQLVEAYGTGIKIFNYKYMDIPREHNDPATPKFLLKDALTHNDYALRYGNLYYERLNKTLTVINFLRELAETAYYEKHVNNSDMRYGREEFRYLMRNWVFARSVFYYETIEWPLGVMESRLESFHKKGDELRALMENINQSITSLKSEIEFFNIDVLKEFTSMRETVNKYLQGFTSKKNVSSVMTSETALGLITKLQNFFQETRAREISLQDWLTRMREDTYDIWQTIVEDTDSKEYYIFLNKTEYCKNFTDVFEEVTTNYSQIFQDLHFSDMINQDDSVFIRDFYDFLEDIESFEKSIKIDNQFIKNNFLQLNIFYRQMSYEDIKQQIAYDIFALWCDIGGSMGLFLGASVLSIFELLDLFSKNILHKKKMNGQIKENP